EDTNAYVIDTATNPRRVRSPCSVHGGQCQGVVRRFDGDLLFGVVGPDAAQLLLGDVRADRHFHVWGGVGRVGVLAQAYAPDRRAGGRVQEHDVAAGHVREDPVFPVLGEEEHVGPLRVAPGFLAGLSELVAQVQRFSLRALRILRKALAVIDVESPSSIFRTVRLINYPNLVRSSRRGRRGGGSGCGRRRGGGRGCLLGVDRGRGDSKGGGEEGKKPHHGRAFRYQGVSV